MHYSKVDKNKQDLGKLYIYVYTVYSILYIFIYNILHRHIYNICILISISITNDSHLCASELDMWGHFFQICCNYRNSKSYDQKDEISNRLILSGLS